jgi:hypothetical protein
MTYRPVCNKSNATGVYGEQELPTLPFLRSPRFFTCLIGVRVIHFVKLHVFKFSVLGYPLRYPRKHDIRFVFAPLCFVRRSGFIYVICSYLRCWCPTWFPYQMMFVSLNSNTTGVKCGVGTANSSGAPEQTPGF